MRIDKQVLRPGRLRQVPDQFSWVDQSLVQWGLIDRMDARCCALYLFLVTVADAQGLSYYGGTTLAKRLHLTAVELDAARAGLIELDLIAYQAPLYQVLALGAPAPRTPPALAIAPIPRSPELDACRAGTHSAKPALSASSRTASAPAGGPISLAQLIALERSHAQV